MALSFNDMKAKVSETTVHWQEESFDVGYFPASLTPNMLASIQEQGRIAAAAEAEGGTTDKAKQSLTNLANMIEPLVAWWDILDGDGNRLPATAETIGELPVQLTMAVFKAVQEAIAPPAPRG